MTFYCESVMNLFDANVTRHREENMEYESVKKAISTTQCRLSFIHLFRLLQ